MSLCGFFLLPLAGTPSRRDQWLSMSSERQAKWGEQKQGRISGVRISGPFLEILALNSVTHDLVALELISPVPAISRV